MTLAAAAPAMAEDAGLLGQLGHMLSESAPRGTIATLLSKEFLRERRVPVTSRFSPEMQVVPWS